MVGLYTIKIHCCHMQSRWPRLCPGTKSAVWFIITETHSAMSFPRVLTKPSFYSWVFKVTVSRDILARVLFTNPFLLYSMTQHFTSQSWVMFSTLRLNSELSLKLIAFLLNIEYKLQILNYDAPVTQRCRGQRSTRISAVREPYPAWLSAVRVNELAKFCLICS